MKFPRFDQRIEHADPEREATLGWAFELDDVDTPDPNAKADLLLASFFKDVDGVHDVGEAFVHRGPALSPPGASAFITPHVIEEDEDFGQLKVTIADVRGLDYDPSDVANLAFIPSPFRTADLSACAGGAASAKVGALDVYDLTNPLAPAWLMTIDPPPPPDQDISLPCGVGDFGHWSDVGDIDGDHTNDLVVGAPDSDGGQGLVYILFGTQDFTTPYYPHPGNPGWLYRWAILYPPPDPATGPTFVGNANFGFCVSLADLDGDGKAELGVSRVEKGVGPGRVHLFHGAWLAEQVSDQPFTHITPLAPESIDAGVPGVYETLIDNEDHPSSQYRPSQPAAFGWILSLKGGDLGQPGVHAFDTKPDVLVHSEAAAGRDVTGTRIVDAGALSVYWNDSTGPGSLSLVDEAMPVKLMTPRIPATGGQPAYGPQTNARFGRAFAVVAWQLLNGEATTILVVGEPDRRFPNPAIPGQWLDHAGAAFAFELPIPPDFDPHSLTDPHINAWGSAVLREPDDGLPQNAQADLTAPGAMTPTPGADFAAWIEEGVYDTDFPGQQIALCARSRKVNGLEGVGRVYTVTLPTTP